MGRLLWASSSLVFEVVDCAVVSSGECRGVLSRAVRQGRFLRVGNVRAPGNNVVNASAYAFVREDKGFQQGGDFCARE